MNFNIRGYGQIAILVQKPDRFLETSCTVTGIFTMNTNIGEDKITRGLTRLKILLVFGGEIPTDCNGSSFAGGGVAPFVGACSAFPARCTGRGADPPPANPPQ